jgi:formylglycine-generating enzyme required for sulfatase activity
MLANLRPRLAALALSGLACCASVAPSRAGSPPQLDPTTGMALVLVPGGCFQMGDVFGDGEVEEQPVHRVCLGDFLMGQHEVTRAEWRLVMGTDPSQDRGCEEERCPVESVSWDEVQVFLARLGARSGARYRLPTEAEWEYAARSGGRAERYAGGGEVDRVAWYTRNSGRRNHPVGQKSPNGLGLHDMSGNVWEWTADWYDDGYYAVSPRQDPSGPAAPAGPTVDHVIRGGCKTGEAANERTSRRSYGYQRSSSDRADKIGFRLVRDP